MPLAETSSADPELVEFIHRMLLRTASASLFPLRNTSRWPIEAKQVLVGQTWPTCVHRAIALSHWLFDSGSWEPSSTNTSRVSHMRSHSLPRQWLNLILVGVRLILTSWIESFTNVLRARLHKGMGRLHLLDF